MRAIILSALLVLAACSTGPQRAAILNSLVGAPETELVRQMGVPSRTFETDGHRFLAYREQRTSIVGGPVLWGGGWGGWGGGWGYAGAWPADVVESVCETTFEVVDGRVARWSLRGNACN